MNNQWCKMGDIGNAEELIKEEVLKIAREHAGKRPVVRAVFRGQHPLEKTFAYYFVIGKEFGIGRANSNDKDFDEFEDKLSELELIFYRRAHIDFGALPWPIELEDAGDYDFLGECIYRFDETAGKA